jgi:hypothetical protein
MHLCSLIADLEISSCIDSKTAGLAWPIAFGEGLKGVAINGQAIPIDVRAPLKISSEALEPLALK